jgi:hypothetical protein
MGKGKRAAGAGEFISPPRASRKTAGLSREKCYEGMPLELEANDAA